MRSQLISFAALASVAAAQGNLPACAQSCIPTSFPNCGISDIKCICSDPTFLGSISCCVATKCDAADQAATIKFADGFCAAQGVTNLPQSAVCSTGAAAAASSTSSEASAAESSAASTTTLTSSGSDTTVTTTSTSSGSTSAPSLPASVSSALASITSGSTTGSASTTVSGTGSSSSGSGSASGAAASSTTGMNGAHRVEGMGLGLAIAGVLALL